ncbi:MAG TPA: GNAT family N-acetyltransferase [Jiangellales bacterium]|nr:GNAT family N-acetyltransferase [Jiangellales bacterium]
MTLQPSDVGRRVVVRYRLAEPVNGAHATDVLGQLVDWAGGRLTVRTKLGKFVEVPESDVLAAKVVPPRTVTRRTVRDLEAAAADGWRALEIEQLGGWLLRAAGGFTGRANSCLPLTDPGVPVDVAISLVEKWYRARNLVPAFQLPAPLSRSLQVALDQHGWPPPPEDNLVLTADLAALATEARRDLPPVELAPEPDDRWLAAYRYRGTTLPPNARSVLVNADVLTFAAVVVDGRVVAIGRGAVSDSPAGRRWLGLTAVEVDPAMRRRGLASHVVARLAEWARGHRATDSYLQVAEGNAAAIAMYERLGFTGHHRYHYRRLP